MFRYPGRVEVRNKIRFLLDSGNEKGLRLFLKPGMEIEGSAVLSWYIENLLPPLIPVRVEELISGKYVRSVS